MRALFTKVPLLTLAALVLGGCGSDKVELRVDVRTDWVPAVEFAEIEVSLDGEPDTVIYDAAFEDDFLRGVRVATLEEVKPGLVTVRARMLAADGRRLVQRRVTARISGNSTLTLVFTRSCAAVSCPDGDPSATECVGGRCVSPQCSPENPEACGDGGCETDDDCGDAPVGCARTICTAGECFIGSDFSACATSEFCHPQFGCQPRPTDGGDGGTPMDGGMSMVDGGTDPLDMGPPEECGMACDTGNDCEIGVYDCSSGEPICVRDRLVAAGTTCREAVGECDVAEECDGESPACPMDAFAPTGATCSAGFCDGLGTCSAGCTPGAACSTGNPCETGIIDCTGGTPSCTRSGNAPDGTRCGTEMSEAWGTCEFSGTCDETGTRSRSVMTPTCSGGTCSVVTTTQTEACMRNTDGLGCGSTETTGWSRCSFSDVCDETGTQSRTITTYTCSSASCGSTTTTETRACTRDTDGDGCGMVTYGMWGGCFYRDTCDETGSRSRSVMTPTCSGGTCSVVTTTQTEACVRDTDGIMCQATTLGVWSRCTYSDPCIETGTRTRTNTVYACAAGSCQGTPQVENGTCTRDTDGMPCVGVDLCQNYYCTSGACTGFNACVGAEQCCGPPQGCTTDPCF